MARDVGRDDLRNTHFFDGTDVISRAQEISTSSLSTAAALSAVKSSGVEAFKLVFAPDAGMDENGVRRPAFGLRRTASSAAKVFPTGRAAESFSPRHWIFPFFLVPELC